ncbi:glycoside hydrolase family 3 domain protein [Kribbella flavida DSM 17836]|uniref:Exo-alpha-(1->6)-L-arabinopyranosidase n=1 Tax=Kribbella flavida (strain DSM 17836 / JCM 10339 / NBRC 14399) TaxID=479435 RepID=D2PPF7_KRIFD|nr:glycoside hydrolase family 3 C-terminal domain-containing protein [Kribbella flavida]ADB30919.1 glycoside hydrolase family 3 domain protein [Kribbella flavida DSM 17836]
MSTSPPSTPPSTPPTPSSDSSPPPFRDPARKLPERIGDLLDRLTLPEKLGLLHQHQAAVPRLGVASFRTGTEALHGVAWLGPATVFPQAIGLAASWNTELLQAVGSAIGDEVRAFHRRDPAQVGLNVWAPVVNPLRDPRWGRNEEGYSEDPWLTGLLAVAYGQGLTGTAPGPLKTAPTLKHFLAYNNETDRCTTSSNLPPRVLHDYELPAFRAPIAAGAAVAVMPSYNLVNGRPAHLSPLINDALRSWTEDDLLVVSDAGAPANLYELQRYYADGPTAYAAALCAGVDSFTQDDNDAGPSTRHLTAALDRGLLTQDDIDQAVRHALAVRFRLGEFDPPELDPYAALDDEVVGCPEHRQLAQEAARQSIVLLKHECHVLPLDPATTRRVAIVGPLADTLYEDWYSGTLPYRVTARDGLVERLGAEAVEFCEGVDRVELRVPGGCLSAGEDGVLGLGPSGGFDLFDWGGAAWTLRSVQTGSYVTVTDGGVLRADHPGPSTWEVNETFELCPAGETSAVLRHRNSGRFVTVQPDGSVTATAEDADSATAFAVVTLVDGAAVAAELAARADVAIVVAGNHPLVNGRETEDREALDLPAGQDRLVRAVHAANSRTVLVMSSSYPFSVEWADEHLPALLWSAHGGQEYGRALADVLFGDTDPSGRLPQTWYRSAADLPDLLDYDIVATDATYLYYRGRPLYPFGHGLSYTTFAYSDLRLCSTSVPADGVLQVSLTVTNTGSRAGREVVQLYTHQQRSRAKQPLRQLRDFRRVSLAAGESIQVHFELPAAELAFFDVTRNRRCVETARHSVLVGRFCTDTRLTAAFDVHGERIPPRAISGGPLAATAFDEYCAVTLTDTTPVRGDAVRSLEAGAWLLFEDVDLSAGPGRCVATVASEHARSATLELRLDDPLRGTLLGTIDVPPTGHRHTWTDQVATLAPADGVRALYVVFSSEEISLEKLTFLFH